MSPENGHMLRCASAAVAAAYIKYASLPRLRAPCLWPFCGDIVLDVCIDMYVREKMNFKVLIAALLVAVFSCPSAWCADQPNPKIWEPLNSYFYYNKKVITKSPGFLLVWTYKTIPEDIREKTIEDVRKTNPEKSIKYKDYHHETVLWEIDCNAKLIRTEEFIDFDKDGKVLDRYRGHPSEWNRIFAKTGGETLYRKACLPKKEPVKKKKFR